MAVRVRVPEPKTCKNCANLCWGTDQGWDKCAADGLPIAWSDKANTYCDDHAPSPYPDPRVHKDHPRTS